MANTRSLILLLLILSLLFSGCASQRSNVVVKSQAIGHSDLVSNAQSGDSLEKVRHSDYRTARWIVFGTIVVLIVVVDLFLLPAYHRRRDCFPCTRTVVIWVED